MSEPSAESPPAASPGEIAAAKRSWMVATTVVLVVIWLAVLVISVFAPDLVSGSEQEHLPLAALTTWLWGAVATAAALWTMNSLRGETANRSTWVGYSVAVACIWLVATVLALAVPDFETGSDPTSLPLAALLVPIAAAVLTAVAGAVAVGFSRDTAWE